MSWAVSWSAMRPSSSVRLTVLRSAIWRSSSRFRKVSSFFLSMGFDKLLILVILGITVKCVRMRIRCCLCLLRRLCLAAYLLIVCFVAGIIFGNRKKGNRKKAALVMAARKEAGEGNVSRKATPKFGCPGLHQDTQSVEIEKLGIGEVISNLRASFVCF